MNIDEKIKRYMNYDDDERDPDFRIDFKDPGGRSALRAATKNNPRIYSCPTCGRKNMLTRKDKQLGYQCDICADQDEGRFG